jgi:hypothetical protein
MFIRAGAPTTGEDTVVTVGPALQIRWKEQDLEFLQTHPLTPGLALATTPEARPTPIPSLMSPSPAPTAEPAPTATTTLTPKLPTPTTSTTSLTERPDQPTIVPSGGDSSTPEVSTDVGDLTSGVPPALPSAPSGETAGQGTPPINVDRNPGALAAIILSAVVISAGVVGLAFLLSRRYHRKANAQQLNSPQSWFWPCGKNRSKQHTPRSVGENGDAELAGSPIAEMGAEERGNSPVELDGREVGLPMFPQHRWSWFSHTSSTLSVLPWRSPEKGSLSRVDSYHSDKGSTLSESSLETAKPGRL